MTHSARTSSGRTLSITKRRTPCRLVGNRACTFYQFGGLKCRLILPLMTISDACGAKHVNLRKMSYPACRSRHAIYRALSSVLSRPARSTNAWWRRAFYASVFPSRWAVTVLDWLISLSWRRSFIPSMLTSHSPCSPRCSGLRRWWLAANQSSTNGFCRLFLRPRVHRLPHSLRPNPAAAPTSDLYRQEKASAPPRGGLATRGSSRAGSNGYLRPPDGTDREPTCSRSSAAPMPPSNPRVASRSALCLVPTAA